MDTRTIERRICDDLARDGPATVEDLLVHGSPGEVLDALAALVHRRAVVPVDAGGETAYVLGPAARTDRGIRSNWMPRPQRIRRNLLLRRCLAALMSAGWTRRDGGALRLPAVVGPDGTRAYVAAYASGPTARHVRRILAARRTALIAEGAVLIVFTPRWRRLTASSAARSPWVMFLPLPQASPQAASGGAPARSTTRARSR